MKYPENERFLQVRPCFNKVCMGVKPAAKLLAYLLFRANGCEETTYSFSCTQEELIDGLCEEVCVKTLHNTAVPLLRLLGFLETDGASYRYAYTVHLDRTQRAIDLASNSKQLELFLIAAMRKQLELFPEQLEKLLIELEKVPIQLEKLLIPFRNIANSKRGRKPCPRAASLALLPDHKNLKEEKKKQEESRKSDSLRTASADAPHAPDALSAPLSFEDDAEETIPRLPAMPRPETASQHTSLALVQSPQQVLPAVSVAPDTGHTGEQAAFGQRAPVAPGANVNTTPPHPEKPPTNPALPAVKPARKAKADPADTPKGPPAMPTADMPWGTRKCQAWFDYWRGGIPISTYKLMQASTCAKGLAEQFDEATVIRIRGVMEADPYYVALGGCDICDVANNIRKYLKREQAHRPAAPDTANATGRGPLVSLEQRQKNIDAAKARVAAKQAALSATPGRTAP